MSTEALREAVVRAGHYLSIERSGNVEFVRLNKSDWQTILQALRDQDAALATHRANYDALVIRLGEVTARLDAADGLLRECLSVMELHPATHARITAHLGGEHE